MWNELSKVDAPWETVLGFSPAWVDEDYNPLGIRECFKNGDGTQWISARWNNYHDYYVTDDSEENGSKPTHWMPLPAPPNSKQVESPATDTQHRQPAICTLYPKQICPKQGRSNEPKNKCTSQLRCEYKQQAGA